MIIAPGQRLGGKLLVVRPLGAGAIGAVWEVEHLLTRHHRALKVLHPRFAVESDVVERFLREASAAGRIGNPHIVETFDAGAFEDGTHYLLMELLHGEPLAARLRSLPGPGVSEAVGWLRQTCLGLAAAHASGIVHRDLKPENLFLTSRPEGRVFVKLLDFGISLFEEVSSGGGDRLTREGSALGTPLYMSPEQLQGQRVDLRADLYALGVILFECLALRPPYQAPNLQALALKVLSGPVPSLRAARGDVPQALSDVVARLMHPDRAQRFGSALELYEALAPFTSADPREDEALAATLSPAGGRGGTAKTLADSAALLEPPARVSPLRRWWWLGLLAVVAGTLPLLVPRGEPQGARQDAGVLAVAPVGGGDGSAPAAVVVTDAGAGNGGDAGLPASPGPDAGARRPRPSTLIPDSPY